MTKLDIQLEMSDKGSFEAPLIEKGYYAAKLVDIKKREKDGKEVDGKYGKELIFEFAIYNKDKETVVGDKITTKTDNIEKDVTISQFVTYMRKNDDGTYSTGLTPKSRFTIMLKALGLEFNPEIKVSPADFIGNWCEVLVADYVKEGTDLPPRSVIKDFAPLKGAVKGKIEKKGSKLKVEDVTPEGDTNEKLDVNEDTAKKIKELENKKKELAKLLKDDCLTQEGYKQAIEQINTSIEALKK